MIAAAGHPHQPRRQDLARRRRRPRHGQDLRVRRRGARRRHRRPPVHGPRRHGRRTRATSSRSTAPPARSSSARCRSSPSPVVRVLRGRPRRTARTPTSSSRPCTGSWRHADERAPAGGARQRRHRRGRRRGPAASAPQGIGLCRTEHMFLGERRQLVERLILADDDEEREAALAALLPAAARGLRRASSRRWTACRSRSGCSTRRCTSSCPTSPSCRCGWRWPRPAASSDEDELRAARRRSSGCTSRTRCWACAACGSASSSPACSPCRCGRSLEAAAERDQGRRRPARRRS